MNHQVLISVLLVKTYLKRPFISLQLRAKACLFQQAGGGIKKAMQKNYNLKIISKRQSSILFCPLSYSSLSFAVCNCFTLVTHCNMYLTCLMQLQWLHSVALSEETACNKEIHSDAFSFCRESCRQDVIVCKGTLVITFKCTLTLDSRQLHNRI